MTACYDISHKHAAFLSLYDGGKMDGADKEVVKPHARCKMPDNPQFKFASNAAGEVQPYFDIARQYGFANRMFQTNQGPSFPAHQFLFSGTSAPDETSPLFVSENVRNLSQVGGCVAPPKQRVKLIDAQGSETSNAPIYPCFDHPTIAARIDEARLGWRYYVNTLQEGGIWNAPSALSDICGAAMVNGVLQCASPRYARHVDSRKAQVLTDIAACSLSNVSWVIPDAADSDHAGVNKGLGPAWVASIVNAIGTQAKCANGDTYWNSTAILIVWDDWGGWYDHVPPFHSPEQSRGRHWGAGYTYGLRVPLLVVSAYTQAAYVDNINHDFGSILKFVESNFGLGNIGPGYYADAYADDLSSFFTLASPRPYQLLAAKPGADYFLNAVRSAEGPDED